MACRILVPQPGIEPMTPALGSWNLNYWTAREIPCLFINKDRHLYYSVTILPMPSILQAFNNFLKNNQTNKHSKILCFFFFNSTTHHCLVLNIKLRGHIVAPLKEQSPIITSVIYQEFLLGLPKATFHNSLI